MKELADTSVVDLYDDLQGVFSNILLWQVFPEEFYYKHKDSRESAPTIDDLKNMVLEIFRGCNVTAFSAETVEGLKSRRPLEAQWLRSCTQRRRPRLTMSLARRSATISICAGTTTSRIKAASSSAPWSSTGRRA